MILTCIFQLKVPATTSSKVSGVLFLILDNQSMSQEKGSALQLAAILLEARRESELFNSDEQRNVAHKT
jgi:hypothetical protein